MSDIKNIEATEVQKEYLLMSIKEKFQNLVKEELLGIKECPEVRKPNKN